MSNPIRWFVNVNKKCFKPIAKLFPQTKYVVGKHYEEQVTANLFEGCTVLDIGGGRTWRFRNERERFHNLKMIALDISEEELSYNHDADEKVLFAMGTDECSPLENESVDLVTSHMVLEHIENNDNTIREVSRILKKGGKFISVMPNKFALFSVLNQMLPNWLARKVLFAINPSSKGICGFKAYYNKTYYPALKKLLEKHNFTDIEFSFHYDQSDYFSFFIPFGIIALVWDFLMYIFGIKPLCAYVHFTARKG